MTLTAVRLPTPMLHEDGTRADWMHASYEPSVSIRSRRAVVRHVLQGAPQLARLVVDGKAGWATEVRCPRTMLSELHVSAQPEQSLAISDSDVASHAYLIPGLVAVEPLSLDTAGLDPFVWGGADSVAVPVGWWLARGDARSARPLSAALVRFARDNAGTLSPGQMSVKESVADDGSPCFRVTLAQDIWPEVQTDRKLQIAGLIAACGLLPLSSLGDGGENWDAPVAEKLRERLDERGLSDWSQPDYDPAVTATLLEAFVPRPTEDDSE